MSDKLTYRVDIVFCIDISGNNRDFLKQFKVLFPKIIDDIKNEFTSKDRYVEVVRIRFLGFNDLIEESLESDFFIIPGQEDELEFFLMHFKSKGGGVGYTIGINSLENAIKSKWSYRGDKNRHIIFYYSNNMNQEIENLNRLTDIWESNNYTNNTSKRLVLFTPNDKPWDEVSTNWNNVIHYPSENGLGLNIIDFNTILSAIICNSI